MTTQDIVQAAGASVVLGLLACVAHAQQSTQIRTDWLRLGADLVNRNPGNVGIGTQSPGALFDVAGTFQVKGPRPWADICAHGAVSGDGLDDTQAIAAAVAAVTPTGGIVFLPPGTYTLQGTIELPPRVNIVGAGREASVIEYGGTDVAFKKHFAVHDYTTDLNTTYKGFAVAGTPSGRGAFSIKHANFVKFEDLYVHGFTNAAVGVGIELIEDYWTWTTQCRFESIGSACMSLKFGSVADGGTGSGCNATYIGPNNEFNGNGMTNCIGVNAAGQNIVITQNDFEGGNQGSKAINLVEVEGVLIEGNYIEKWANGAIVSDATGSLDRRIEVNNNVIQALSPIICNFHNPGGTAADRVVITNNRFADAQAFQTCVHFGFATRVTTSGNDPAGATFSDRSPTDGMYRPAFTATAVWDPGSIGAGQRTSADVPVPGAVRGDAVSVGLDQLNSIDLVLSGFVTADGVVRVVLHNLGGTTINLPSGTLRVVAFRGS